MARAGKVTICGRSPRHLTAKYSSAAVSRLVNVGAPCAQRNSSLCVNGAAELVATCKLRT
eukprot:3712512-Pleurochrysis_carterae.AAC.4